MSSSSTGTTTEQPSLNWLGLATLWFGGMISVPSLLIGSTLVSGLPFGEAMAAGFIGFAVVTIFMCLESVAAVDQRQDTVGLAASAFGRRGAGLVLGVALGGSLIGWFGVQSGVAGASMARIAQLSFGLPWTPGWCSLVLGLLMLLTAVFGFRYLKWLNFLAVPCKVLVVFYAVYVCLQDQGFAPVLAHQPDPEHRLDFLTAVGLSIGFFSVGGVISPDYGRHARTRRDAVLGSTLGMLPAALSMAACGSILAILKNSYDIVEIYSKLGMPILALTALIIANWTTNVMNAYSGGLALKQLLRWGDERRSLATLIAGVLGSLLAAFGLYQNFMGFLLVLTATIPPIAGVLVGDYWIARTYRREGNPGYRASGLIAWASGCALMLLLDHPLRAVLGIVVAAVVYALLARSRLTAARAGAG